MGIVRAIFRELLHSLAEIEVRFSTNSSPLFFRKAYLHLMQVHFEDDLWIGPMFRLSRSGNLVLGHRCAIGAYAVLQNPGPIRIGDDFLASSRLTLAAGGHDPETLDPVVKGITIGNRVWCGVNVTVLDGVTIGDDVVIGAGSVVCKDIPSNSIAVGVPARKIKTLERGPETRCWQWARAADAGVSGEGSVNDG